MEKNNMKLQFAPICTTKTLISHIDTDGCDDEFVKATANIVKDFTIKLQELADINKEEQKKKEINKRWKPEIDENYFNILADGYVNHYTWKNDRTDNANYNLRNVFKTREEAEFEVERRKVMIELQNYADEHNGETAHPSDAFWIAFDEDDMSITVETESYLPPVGAVLFSDADTAYDAIEAIGENRILEYMFRVNPKYMFRVNPNKELHCNGDCECCDEYDPWDEEDED